MDMLQCCIYAKSDEMQNKTYVTNIYLGNRIETVRADIWQTTQFVIYLISLPLSQGKYNVERVDGNESVRV
jgi:hypothetical protein